MARRGRPRHPDILTPREWDVLALLREGLTNDQIAQRLGITERTAKFHVSEILSKLDVSSREEAAAWQPEERRPWWFALSAPFAFLWRKSSGGLNALGLVIGAGMVAAVIAGIVLLALFLSRGGGPSGAVTSMEPRIAFSAGGSIYTVVPDGSDLRKVIPGDRSGGSWNAAPAFSPDGSHIAFTRNYDIWIANSDGSDAHELAAVADLQTPPDGAASNFSLGAQSIAWSPDGEQIAYILGRIGGSGVQDLWVIRADGTERLQIYQSGASWMQPFWLDSDQITVYDAPGQVHVFSSTNATETRMIQLAFQQYSSVAALRVHSDFWLIGPITQGDPILYGSGGTAYLQVATGIGAALAPGGTAFAYFSGDTLRIAAIDGSADEQIVDLAPLGGRDRFFGEQPDCFPDSSPACSYRLPTISWAGP